MSGRAPIQLPRVSGTFTNLSFEGLSVRVARRERATAEAFLISETCRGGEVGQQQQQQQQQEAGSRNQEAETETNKHNLSLIQFVFISLLFEIEKMTRAIYLCIEYGFAHILLTMLTFFFPLALRSLLRQIQVSKFKQECGIQLENPSHSHHSHPATGPSC